MDWNYKFGMHSILIDNFRYYLFNHMYAYIYMGEVYECFNLVSV